MTDTNITSLNRPTNPNEPASWWRVLCTVATSRLIITGDLPNPPLQRAELLQRWADAGVTDIVDCRRSEEHTSEPPVTDVSRMPSSA